jgi:hypothetical protein
MLNDLQLLPLEAGRAVLTGLFTGIFLAFELGLSGCIILALLHRVLRKRALAIASYAVIRPIFLLQRLDLPGWLILLPILIEILLLTRYGLLTIVVSWYVTTVMAVYVFTSDLSLWFAGSSLMILVGIIAMGVYYCYWGITGRYRQLALGDAYE